MAVVRYFDDDEGEAELAETVITEDGAVLEKLPGQHQLLGCTLAAEHLAFLASAQACLVVDEYG